MPPAIQRQTRPSVFSPFVVSMIRYHESVARFLSEALATGHELEEQDFIVGVENERRENASILTRLHSLLPIPDVILQLPEARQLSRVEKPRVTPGNNFVTVEWDTVPNAKKYQISFEYIHNERGVHIGRTFEDPSPTEQTIIVYNKVQDSLFSNGARFSFRVRALGETDEENGEYSEMSDDVIIGEIRNTPPRGQKKLATVQNFMVIPRDNEVELRWDQVLNAESYRIMVHHETDAAGNSIDHFYPYPFTPANVRTNYNFIFRQSDWNIFTNGSTVSFNIKAMAGSRGRFTDGDLLDNFVSVTIGARQGPRTRPFVKPDTVLPPALPGYTGPFIPVNELDYQVRRFIVTPTGSRAQLSWQEPLAIGVVRYEIQIQTTLDETGQETLPIERTTPSTTSFSFRYLPFSRNAQFRFRVRAVFQTDHGMYEGLWTNFWPVDIDRRNSSPGNTTQTPSSHQRDLDFLVDDNHRFVSRTVRDGEINQDPNKKTNQVITDPARLLPEHVIDAELVQAKTDIDALQRILLDSRISANDDSEERGILKLIDYLKLFGHSLSDESRNLPILRQETERLIIRFADDPFLDMLRSIMRSWRTLNDHINLITLSSHKLLPPSREHISRELEQIEYLMQEIDTRRHIKNTSFRENDLVQGIEDLTIFEKRSRDSLNDFVALLNRLQSSAHNDQELQAVMLRMRESASQVREQLRDVLSRYVTKKSELRQMIKYLKAVDLHRLYYLLHDLANVYRRELHMQHVPRRTVNGIVMP